MISIIFPTLNEEKVLETTLTSFKRMTLPHELIVSDGKSTDKTIEIARRLADKVIVYSGERRQRIAEGRNDGAAAASGEYIVLLDADCTVKDPDEFFKRAVSHFEKNPQLVALVGWLKVLPEYETFFDWLNFGVTNIGNLLLNNVFHVGGGQEFHMMRADAFRRIGGYNGELAVSEDVDLFRRLSAIGRTYFDRKLVIYHTGRRAHKIGWIKLQWQWFINTFLYSLRGRPHHTEWEQIR